MHYDALARLPQRDTRFGLSIGRFNLVYICVLNLLGLLAACSGTSGSRALNVGDEPGSATSGMLAIGGTASGGALSTGGSDGLGNQVQELAVQVEDDKQMTIEIVTLACAGDCKDIKAVAHGGNPPYDFSWEDGSDNPERTICLDAAKSISIEVTDSGRVDGEFAEGVKTVMKELSASVLSCESNDGALCIENGTFSGSAGLSFLSFTAPPWVACEFSPDIISVAVQPNLLSPPDGDTVLRLVDGAESVGQELCATMRAGEPYSLMISAYQMEPVIGEQGVVNVFGSSQQCGQGELLWESPKLSNGWENYCVTLLPSQDATHIVVSATGFASNVAIDNLVPVDSCAD